MLDSERIKSGEFTNKLAVVEYVKQPSPEKGYRIVSHVHRSLCWKMIVRNQPARYVKTCVIPCRQKF